MAASPIPPPTLKTAIILLFRSAPPFVLYPSDTHDSNADTLYTELKNLITAADPKSPKLVEKTGSGPMKRVAFLDTELIGVSMQVGVLPQMPA